MSTVTDAILDGFIPDASDLEPLREAAIGRCHALADSMNLSAFNALDNLSLYSEFEPDPAEVREFVSDAEGGDWRASLLAAGYIATREYLGSQVNADVDALQAAIQEAEAHGYRVVGFYPASVLGQLPHESETVWTTGVLYQWPQGGRRQLCVPVTEGQAIWLELTPIA